jgi:hypothetical protein
MSNKVNYKLHDFYCTECGQKGIPLCRTSKNIREKFHIKDLYCINCKTITKHIETRFCDSEEEVLIELSKYKKKGLTK